MPFRKLILFFFFIWICIPFLACAQSVSGTVYESDTKQVLPGALILVKDGAGKGIISDPSGTFLLHLRAGKHTIICSFLGMVSDTVDVELSTGQNFSLDFRLRYSSNEMRTIVVSAGKYEQRLEEIPVSMQVLSSKLIESKNTVNIKSALEQSPGLVILDEEPQMRGGSGFSFGVGSRVATLIDGLPILTGDAGRTDWNFIPVENIEQVEIVEGASSVLHGSSALSGTINFLTRYPKDSGNTYVRGYSGFYSAPQNDSAKWWNGSANFSGLNFSHSNKFRKSDLVVGGQVNYDHNYIGPYILDGSLPIQADTLDNSDVANRSGRFNFNYRYRPGNSRFVIGAGGNIMTAHTNFSLVWGNSKEGIYRAFPGTMTLTDFTAWYLDPFVIYYGARGGKHQVKARWYYSDNNNNNGQGNQTDVYMSEYGYTREFRKLGALRFTGGLFYNDSHSSALLYSGSGSSENVLRNSSVFAQLEKKFFRIFTIIAGMRGEYYKINEEQEEVRPVFRAGLNAKITRGTHLRFSYGQGFRYPTLAEKFITTTTGGIYVFPNQTIQPESSWNMEAGLKQGFKIGSFSGLADLAFFRQEYSNTIEYMYAIWKPDSAGFKFINTGNTRVKGFEVSVMGESKTGANTSLRLLAGYTYVIPQTLEPEKVFAIDNPADGIVPTALSYSNTSTDAADNILKYRFRHIAKADVEFSYKAISAGVSVRYYSFMQNIDKTFYDLDQPFLLPTGIKQYREENNEGATVFDARLSLKINKAISVALISNNITNLEYTLRPLKIESPRTYLLQITYKK